MLCGFDFVVTPLLRPDYRPPSPEDTVKSTLAAPFSRDDVLYLPSTQYQNQASAGKHRSYTGGVPHRSH